MEYMKTLTGAPQLLPLYIFFSSEELQIFFQMTPVSHIHSLDMHRKKYKDTQKR